MNNFFRKQNINFKRLELECIHTDKTKEIWNYGIRAFGKNFYGTIELKDDEDLLYKVIHEVNKRVREMINDKLK